MACIKRSVLTGISTLTGGVPADRDLFMKNLLVIKNSALRSRLSLGSREFVLEVEELSDVRMSVRFPEIRGDEDIAEEPVFHDSDPVTHVFKDAHD